MRKALAADQGRLGGRVPAGDARHDLPAADKLEFSDVGVSMFLGGTYTGCADDTQVAVRTFELPQAVGDRFLRDTRSPSGLPAVFRDADLPDLVAAGWTELPTTWSTSGGAVLVFGYARPGGPDLEVRAIQWELEAGSRLLPPDHTLSVDGHQVDVYEMLGRLTAGWWSADGKVRFQLEAPGGQLGKSEFDEIVRGMTWA